MFLAVLSITFSFKYMIALSSISNTVFRPSYKIKINDACKYSKNKPSSKKNVSCKVHIWLLERAFDSNTILGAIVEVILVSQVMLYMIFDVQKDTDILPPSDLPTCYGTIY